MSEIAPSSSPVPDFSEALGPELSSALAKKGYTTLTPVQRSVLDPELAERDLRISSQTGSGKTLAIGFVLRGAVTGKLERSSVARPQALVIVPTRELAKQVNDELSWLYAPKQVRIASVIGGSSYRDEHRSLAQNPAIVVGTPGRLLDHLERGGIEASQVAAVVLDEADRMLDLGFRDELEAILAKTPPGHRTHLVSATFARDVAALADRVQQNPKRIEGTPLGTANRDIDHIIYLVKPAERVDALINLLLHDPDEQTLVFARTRADVSEIALELQQAGFASGSLSGEMSQDQRNRALSAFKRGDTRALIATDVAARGIDVQDITRVIQIDPPTDPDTYTHRSGRTGRAGRKGVSAMLVAPPGLRRATSLLQRARVQFRLEPIPTAAAIRQAQDERWLSELTTAEEREVPERVEKQVARIVEAGLTERALARLIINVRRAIGEPREVTPILPEPARSGSHKDRPSRFDGAGRFDGPRRSEGPGRFDGPRRSDGPGRFDGPARSDGPGRFDGPARFDGPPRAGGAARFEGRAPRSERFERPSELPPSRGAEPRPLSGPEQWVPFRVSWGEAHGADARRLVAMLCRRGGVRGSDIGAIRVGRTSSTVEVAAAVAEGFSSATREPDPRDPRVVVSRFTGEPERAGSAEPPHRPRADVPPSRHRAPRSQHDHPGTRPPRETRTHGEARPLRERPSRDARALRDAPPARESKPYARPRPAAAAPSEDAPPKRPTRKIVVTAPPQRRGPKKK